MTDEVRIERVAGSSDDAGAANIVYFFERQFAEIVHLVIRILTSIASRAAILRS